MSNRVYQYTVESDIQSSTLHETILKNSIISKKLVGVHTRGNQIFVEFELPLTVTEKNELDRIINQHQPAPVLGNLYRVLPIITKTNRNYFNTIGRAIYPGNAMIPEFKRISVYSKIDRDDGQYRVRLVQVYPTYNILADKQFSNDSFEPVHIEQSEINNNLLPSTEALLEIQVMRINRRRNIYIYDIILYY